MNSNRITVLLSGLGYYKLSERRRKLLVTVLLISLAIHAIGLLIFGSYVVMTTNMDEKTVFVAVPPPRKIYEPRKLEHKVKVQKKQRSSSRPTVIPRLAAMKTAKIALPEIKMNPKIINTSFQPKFKAVSGKGVGVGLGTGYGLGGFGTGVSNFDFFGIKGRGDKIAILVDVSVSMVEDERGGVKGFKRVKTKVGQVIDALSDQAMFNVVAFAVDAQIFKDKLQIANDKNKEEAKDFLKYFNVEGNWGLNTGNIAVDDKIGLPSYGGTTRLDVALTACFQQGADTILIISDGAPVVYKPISDATMEAYNRKAEEWYKRNEKKLAAWDKRYSGKVLTKKVWVPAKKGKTTGLKEGVNNNASRDGHWNVVHLHRRPEFSEKPPEPEAWTLREFLTHLNKLHEHYYLKKGTKPPVIHCIGYQIDRPGAKFLRAISRKYKGKFRKVRKAY